MGSYFICNSLEFYKYVTNDKYYNQKNVLKIYNSKNSNKNCQSYSMNYLWRNNKNTELELIRSTFFHIPLTWNLYWFTDCIEGVKWLYLTFCLYTNTDYGRYTSTSRPINCNEGKIIFYVARSQLYRFCTW